MSTPTTHDPLVVNTQDGVVWQRRALTREGRGLYAVADAPACCPEYVMATLAELAEHGLASMTNVLPMPVGSAPVTARQKVDEAFGIEARLFQHALDKVFSVLTEGGFLSTPSVTASLRARVAELEAERHVTNEALDDAVQALRAPTTVYRAEHPDSGITLGHYGTEAAARAHCEETERRSWGPGHTLVLDWIEDDEDRVAELVVTAGQNEESTTGYLVTALELDSEYDAGADE